MFGTLEDFQELCTTYHQKGIRVIIDQVYNHCSEKHPWFQKSIKREGKYTDYFIWRNPIGFDAENKPIPPTNWPSLWSSDGPSAWSWNEERKQFYMHSFDRAMPNLNINNEDVQIELLFIAKHWFDLGADGFRLDAAVHYGCDPLFRNNPIIRGEQARLYDLRSEAGMELINALKRLGNTYPTRKTILAEYGYDKTISGKLKVKNFAKDGGCDAFFTGALNKKLEDFAASVTEDLEIFPFGEKLNWAFSNHDMERAASRLFERNYTKKKLAMLISLLTTLPGSICIFQGEELGLPNPQDFQTCKARENDPLGVWSLFNAPWDAGRGGFAFTDQKNDATRKMALQPDEEQYTLAVSNQTDDEESLLNTVKRCIAERKNGIFDKPGELLFIPHENKDVIAYIRTVKNSAEKMLCIYNFSDETVSVKYNALTYILPPECQFHRQF
jgi:alpha-glucosidase